MGVNKAKSRRERKLAEKPQQQAPVPDQGRKIKAWEMRLLMMIPPVLYACYLIWDMYQQQ